MRRYIRYSIPELLLCLVMSVGLSVSVFQGFYLSTSLVGNLPLLTAVCAALLILLFLAGYDRRSSLIGVLIAIAAVIGSVMLLRANDMPLFTAEAGADNAPLWLLITIICCASVFLLTRSPAGTGALFVLGSLCLSVLAVLEYNTRLWGFVLFLAACGVMFLYRRYLKNVLTISTAKNAFAPVLLYAAVMSGAVLLLSCATWLGIIRPLSPPTKDIRLVTRVVSVDVLDKLGVSRTLQVLDRNTFSDDVNENEHRVSDQMGEDVESIPVSDSAFAAAGSQPDEASDYTARRQQQKNRELLRRVVRYLQLWLRQNVRLLLAAAIVSVLCGSVLFLLRRRMWHRRMLKLPARERSIKYYHWYRKKFAILGFPGPGTDTPLEYAARLDNRTRVLDAPDASWSDMTALFVKTYYGAQPATAEDERLMERYYRRFYPACREMLGARYVLKYFVL